MQDAYARADHIHAQVSDWEEREQDLDEAPIVPEVEFDDDDMEDLLQESMQPIFESTPRNRLQAVIMLLNMNSIFKI